MVIAKKRNGMRSEKLIKIIKDMEVSISNLKEGKNILKETDDKKTAIFIEYGLRYILVDSFITVENFTSIMLKELKKFKIGIDMRDSLEILKENNVLNEEEYLFLNEARLLRNRISHRYKEPSREELLEFIEGNIDKFDYVLNEAKGVLNRTIQ